MGCSIASATGPTSLYCQPGRTRRTLSAPLTYTQQDADVRDKSRLVRSMPSSSCRIRLDRRSALGESLELSGRIQLCLFKSRLSEDRPSHLPLPPRATASEKRCRSSERPQRAQCGRRAATPNVWFMDCLAGDLWRTRVGSGRRRVNRNMGSDSRKRCRVATSEPTASASCTYTRHGFH